MPRIEVHGGSPLSRHGIIASLGELEPLNATGASDTPPAGDGRVLCVYVLADSGDWERLAALSRRPEVITIVLIAHESRDDSARAFRLGASAVLSEGCSLMDLRVAVADAIEGVTRVRRNVFRDLTATSIDSNDLLSIEETRWLQLLSQGMKVKDLAENAGYSERMMFRLLREIYVRLGVAGKVEALVRAQQLGLI